MEQILFAGLCLRHDALAKQIESCKGMLHGQKDLGVVKISLELLENWPLVHNINVVPDICKFIIIKLCDVFSKKLFDGLEGAFLVNKYVSTGEISKRLLCVIRHTLNYFIANFILNIGNVPF